VKADAALELDNDRRLEKSVSAMVPPG